jgi:hypothetical protein
MNTLNAKQVELAVAIFGVKWARFSSIDFYTEYILINFLQFFYPLERFDMLTIRRDKKYYAKSLTLEWTGCGNVYKNNGRVPSRKLNLENRKQIIF